MRFVFLMLATSFLGGCAAQATQGSFTKQGATPEKFMRDRSECVQEASELRSGGVSNGYGGAADSGTIVHCGRWASCMGARGYQSDPNGNLHASWTAAVSCVN